MNSDLERVGPIGLQRASSDSLVQNGTAAGLALPKLALAARGREVTLPNHTRGHFYAYLPVVGEFMDGSRFDAQWGIWSDGIARLLVPPDDRAANFRVTLAPEERLQWIHPMLPGGWFGVPTEEWKTAAFWRSDEGHVTCGSGADQLSRLPAEDIDEVWLSSAPFSDPVDVAHVLRGFPRMHVLCWAPLNTRFWRAMSPCPQLRALSVTQVMDVPSSDLIGGACPSSDLDELPYWSDGITDAAANTALEAVGAAAPELEWLSVQNLVTPLDSNVLIRFTQLRDLCLVGFDEEGVPGPLVSGSCIDGIGELTRLETLSLQWGTDEAADMSRLASAIGRLERLRALYVHTSCQDDAFDQAAVSQLAGRPVLAHAAFGVADRDALAALEQLESIQGLALQHRWVLDPEDLAALERVPRLRHLRAGDVDLRQGIPAWWSRLDTVTAHAPDLDAEHRADYERRHPGARLFPGPAHGLSPNAWSPSD